MLIEWNWHPVFKEHTTIHNGGENVIHITPSIAIRCSQFIKIIGGVYHSHIADAVSREMENKNRKALEQIKEKEATLVTLRETMKDFDDLDKQKQLLQDLKARMNVYQQTMKKI